MTSQGGSTRNGVDDASSSSDGEGQADDAPILPATSSNDTNEGIYLNAAEHAAISIEEIDASSRLFRGGDNSFLASVSGRSSGTSSTAAPIPTSGRNSVRWSDVVSTSHGNGGVGLRTENGSTAKDDVPHHPTDKVPRRTALLRPTCRYGMDAVGEHVASIRTWIESVHRQSDANSPSGGGGGDLGHLGSGLSLEDLLSSSSRRRRRRRRRPPALERSDDGTRLSCDDDEMLVRDDAFPTGVAVRPSLILALDGLAECVDEAARLDDEHERDSAGDLDRIVEAVARVPSFVKTVLLIEDEAERNAVLAYPLMKRVLLCPYSVVNVGAELDASVHDEDDTLSDDGQLRLYKESGRAQQPAKSKWTPIQGSDKSWLLEMLKTGNRRLTDISVEYLEMISGLSVDDYPSVRRSDVDGNTFGGMSIIAGLSGKNASKEDEIRFLAERDSLFQTVARLRLLVTYLFTLPEQQIERVSVTAVVRRSLDEAVSSPFCLFTLFFDLVFHILILMTRFYTFAGILGVEGDFERLEGIDVFWADMLGSGGILALIYFGYRYIGQLVAMSRISWRVFYINLFNFWQILEIAAISMVTYVYVILWDPTDSFSYIDDGYKNFLILSAFTIGLLWFNFVGFLKVLNWKLATFILAIGNIITDIRLFIILLLFIILAFGDMFFTIISVDSEACASNYLGWIDFFNSSGLLQNYTQDESIEGAVNTSPFCDGRGSSYFAIYRVLVGDVQADEYESSGITVVLFVVMTFFIVIVSLNILIAIVDESYERSTMTASHLFGKARIALVAKNSALEHLLHPSDSCNFSLRDCGLARNFMRLLSAAVVVLDGMVFKDIIIAVENRLHDSVGLGRSLSKAIVSAFGIPLFYILAMMLSYLLTGWKTRRQKRLACFYWFQSNVLVKYVFVAPVSFFMANLLGTRKKRVRGGEEEWRGRLNHVESTVLRIVSESESRTRKTIASLQRRLEQSEANRKRDLAAFENRINQLENRAKADRKIELEDMERRIMQAFVEAFSTSSLSKK